MEYSVWILTNEHFSLTLTHPSLPGGRCMNQGFAIKLKYAKVRVFRPSSLDDLRSWICYSKGWNDYDRSLSFDLSLLDKKNGIIFNDFAVERF